MNFCWIIVGQNCADYVKQCLDSVLSQRVPEGCSMHAIVVEDGSSDGTDLVVNKYKGPRVDVFTRPHNEGAAHSRFMAMDVAGWAGNTYIFLCLDLDDYLPHDGVLERVHAEYEKGAQATFGNWRFHEKKRAWPWQPLTPQEIATGAFRQMPFACPPLRTFRADIALQVTPAELQDDNGRWLRCCTDVALSWAVLDRVDPERVAYIQDELYVYRGFRRNVTRKRYRKEKGQVMEMLRRREGVRV